MYLVTDPLVWVATGCRCSFSGSPYLCSPNSVFFTKCKKCDYLTCIEKLTEASAIEHEVNMQFRMTNSQRYLVNAKPGSGTNHISL